MAGSVNAISSVWFKNLWCRTLWLATLNEVNCPRCDASTRTLETRRAPEGDAVRRRRECPSCGHRFTTYERAVPESLVVVKRDGHRQPFNREKLLGALVRASHKRDVDPRKLQTIAERIEQQVHDSGGELTAARIGELCLEGLEKIDRGAYLQFAGTLRVAPPELS